MLIVGNWKAYVESTTKAKALVASAKRLAAQGAHTIVLAPPAPYLGLFSVENKSKVAYAAQDISDSTGGAATGEVTASLLARMGVRYAIIGHSERRALGESDERITRKVQHALAHALTPIVCIGEHERDPEAHYLHFVRAQIASVFAPLSSKERGQIVIAYEPIWAIGKTAAEASTPEDVHEMMLYIRKVLTEYFAGKGSEKVLILYGGSVEPANARALAEGGTVNGFLIGHASADVSTFSGIVKALSSK